MRTDMISYREPVLSVLEDMDSLLGGFFGRDFVPRVATRVPAVDARETEHGYLLEMELPGMDEKDVDVKLAKNVLTVSSSKKDEKEDKKDGWLLRERKTVAFSRSFRIPEDVDPDTVKAVFSKGLLSIELGKKPETKDRVIAIESK